MSYRIEYYNKSTESWLAAHHDFDCKAEYNTTSEAGDWIHAQVEYERSEGTTATLFITEKA